MSPGDLCSLSNFWLLMQDNAAFALQEVIELANGCLCCSVKDDFVQALEALMQQRSRFDYILIETTGRPLSHLLSVPSSSPRLLSWT